MADERERWALILGASSGFGEATALALAADGYHVAGVHLDRRAGMAHVEEIRRQIADLGRKAVFLNMNAADDAQRAEAISVLGRHFEESRVEGRHPYVRVLLHSLAFGTLKPFVADDPGAAINRRNMEMTLDVMAHSLVYWAQDLLRGGFLETGSRIYAMTSEGSTRVVGSYGAVSAAKAALESHCRQLATELARRGTGIVCNAIRAGVTLTPALSKIPEQEELVAEARRRNPSGRLTTREDVARAIVAFSRDGTEWMTGNVLGVDGGEFIAG